MAQAARLQARQRLFNLVVTNVPGPQFPLYLLGRELEAMYPMVPLAENTALGIAIISYNGQLNFGLVADYDALADVEVLADELRSAIEELAAAAGAPAPADGAAPRARRRGARRAVTPAGAPVGSRPGESRLVRVVERVAIGVASLVLSIGLILLLSGYFAGRDQAGVSGGTRPARAARSRTSAHAALSPGGPHPTYNSNPPTSGAHVPSR